MELTIESLQDKIPASAYELLTTEDYMALPLPEETDIAKAYDTIAPPYSSYLWIPVSQRNFTEQEMKDIKSCVVVPSEYGVSMKFEFIDGKERFIPCGNSPLFKEGQEWSPKDLKIIELRKVDEKIAVFRVVPVSQSVTIKKFQLSSEEYKWRTEVSGKLIEKYYDLLKRDGKKINIFKYLRLY